MVLRKDKKKKLSNGRGREGQQFHTQSASRQCVGPIIKKSSDWITYGGGSCTYIDTNVLVTGNFVLLIRGPVNGFTFPHSRFSLSLLGFLETRKYGLKKK